MTAQSTDQLIYRSHRAFGREVARARAADGDELVILQTSETAQTVVRAITVLPVAADELIFEARMALAAAIERARFLGVTHEQIKALFDEEIAHAE